MNINKRNQQGTSMLEVLISVVVLALGLLGYAGLQSVSMKNNHNAYMRSQATVLAADGMDRLRANKAGGTSSAELTAWKTEVANTLPGATATIDLLGTVPPKIRVKISWHDTGDSASLEFITESAL